MRKGVVYKFTCQNCLSIGRQMHYIGESYRSSWDRAQEHQAALRNKDMESPLWEHHAECHGDLEPKFSMKVVSKQRKPLQRQTLEGILVSQAEEGTLMNRKGEWGQNLPPKLEIVDDIWGEKKHLPKRKQESQNPEIRVAGDGDRDKGL